MRNNRNSSANNAVKPHKNKTQDCPVMNPASLLLNSPNPPLAGMEADQPCVLATREERVQLLRAGLTENAPKLIEHLYIELNWFKLVGVGK